MKQMQVKVVYYSTDLSEIPKGTCPFIWIYLIAIQ